MPLKDKKFAERIRYSLMEREKRYLSPFAKLSASTLGRTFDINYDGEFRLAYQRDRDRILHSKAFRRLKGKTQVFMSPVGDHFRTRLTHTLEVSQISRTISRALGLNEDLTEAIALGHDLGHTPFGHFGERALSNIVPNGFHHAKQSLRIAQRMNLSVEVCDGIAKHSKGKGPVLDDNIDRFASTLEGQVVRVSDIIAYINHDLDDAERAGMLTKDKIPMEFITVLGQTQKERMTTMVSDVIWSTHKKMESNFRLCTKRVYMNQSIIEAISSLRDFLFRHVYEHPQIMDDYKKVFDICSKLYNFFMKNQEDLKHRMQIKDLYDEPYMVVTDYISGMTDRFAFNTYDDIFGG